MEAGMMDKTSNPVGVFDSGIGGISTREFNT